MMDEQPHIQGSIRPILKYANGQTAAYCMLCDGHRSYGKKAVVIGYSESAGKIASMLTQKYQLKDSVILTNGQSPQFSAELWERLNAQKITVNEKAIFEIQGLVEQRLLTGFKLEDGSLVEAEMAFVALGIRPNNQLAIQIGAALDESGLVVADDNGETTVPDLFVIGDLRSCSLKQIYSAWEGAVTTMQ